MPVQSIESHSVDMDLLPKRPVVLDVGCRGFDFSTTILRYRPEALVIAMDPDPEIIVPVIPPNVAFLRKALVGDSRVWSNYASWSTGEGNILCERSPWYATKSFNVPCISLPALMQTYGVGFFSLIKLDCEGTEFEILENWPGPIAQQISVEFHDWTGPEKEKATPAYYDALFAGPLRHYDVVQHEVSTVGPGPAWGHWDSLFRLKDGVCAAIG